MKYQQQIDQGRIRRFEILETGLVLYPFVSASAIAKLIGIKHSTVLYHFKDVKKAVEEYALEVNDERVLKLMNLTKQFPDDL